MKKETKKTTQQEKKTNFFPTQTLHLQEHTCTQGFFFFNCHTLYMDQGLEWLHLLHPHNSVLVKPGRYNKNKAAQEGAHNSAVTHSVFISLTQLDDSSFSASLHDQYGKPSASP